MVTLMSCEVAFAVLAPLGKRDAKQSAATTEVAAKSFALLQDRRVRLWEVERDLPTRVQSLRAPAAGR